MLYGVIHFLCSEVVSKLLCHRYAVILRTVCKRELDEVNSEITKMQAYAEKALLAGNEADAMKFLEQKNQLTAKQASLQQTYDVAAANAMKMRQMHDKLVTDINHRFPVYTVKRLLCYFLHPLAGSRKKVTAASSRRFLSTGFKALYGRVFL